MGVSGLQWNILIVITHTIAYWSSNKILFCSVLFIHSIGPFSCVVTAGQLTGQLNLFTVRLHRNIIKGPSLNE